MLLRIFAWLSLLGLFNRLIRIASLNGALIFTLLFFELLLSPLSFAQAFFQWISSE